MMDKNNESFLEPETDESDATLSISESLILDNLGKSVHENDHLDDYSFMLLHLACDDDLLDFAQFLVTDLRIDINFQCSEGFTALILAAEFGNEPMMKMLLDNNACHIPDYGGCTPLIIASYKGHINCVRLLIKNGADIGSKSVSGRTALHAAVCGDHPSVVKLLLESGANVHATTLNGSTPLHHASQRGL